MAGQRLIGQDFARTRVEPQTTRRLSPAFTLLVLGVALGFAVLRIDMSRSGYGLMHAVKLERELLEEHRALTAEVQRLKAPDRLGALASELGLGEPAEILDLPTRSPAPAPSPRNAAPTVPLAADALLAQRHGPIRYEVRP